MLFCAPCRGALPTWNDVVEVPAVFMRAAQTANDVAQMFHFEEETRFALLSLLAAFCFFVLVTVLRSCRQCASPAADLLFIVLFIYIFAKKLKKGSVTKQNRL